MEGYQYDRKCTLILTDEVGNGLDLSKLRIKFNIKKSDIQAPNIANFRIYNLEKKTQDLIEKEFSKIFFQAGYEGNFGVCFEGNVKQIIKGRESATDTFIDIVAGDGDRAYNFAIVNTTLSAGASQEDIVNASLNSLNEKGVTAGYKSGLGQAKLSRGKVLFGMTRDVLKNVADTSKTSWSIQDGKLQFVPLTSYLPNEAVVLTAKTGLIGTPVQTSEGVNLRCLLNPKIRIAGRIQIDNKNIERFKINLAVPNSPANIPAPLTFDGVYYVYVVEYVGDTRGAEWYCDVVTLNVDVTTNPINAVEV